MNLEIITASLVVVCMLIGWCVALQSRQSRLRRDKLSARVMGRYGASQAGTQSAPTLSARLMELLPRIGGLFNPRKEEERQALKRKLAVAGYRGSNAVAVYCGFKSGLFLLGISLGAVLHFLFVHNGKMQFILLTYLACTAACIYIPDFWIIHRSASRKQSLQHSLPDALDLMVVCVEAGMGLDQAIQRVGLELAEGYSVLGDELRLLALELRAGKARRDALRNLAWRTDLDDMNSLVALLIQSDKFGTSIAQTFRVYSDVLRTTRRQRAEEMAAKLPVKLLIPLILFIFPPLMIVILGPAVIRIIQAFSL